MNTNKRTQSQAFDIFVAVLVIFFVTYLGVHAYLAATRTPVTRTAVECNEDEPCWDCETMGNRICGPVQDLPRTADCLASWAANPQGVTATEASTECVS